MRQIIIQEADSAAMDMLRQHDAMKLLSQMPVILLPLHFDRYLVL